MKKTKTDIFDGNNIEDLPKKVIENLKKPRIKYCKKLVMELFDIKEELTVNDVILGLYRLHKIEVTRSWIITVMYQLNKKGILKLTREHHGIYKRVKK